MKIFRKFLQRIKGNKNIVVTNSRKVNIYQGDLTGEIAKSIHEKPSEVSKHLKGLRTILLNGHPLCSFIPDFETGKIKIMPKEGAKININLDFTIPEELKRYSNWQEALNESYKKQKKITIDDVKSYKIFMGEELFEQWEASSKDKSKVYVDILPKKYPPPSPVRIYIEGHDNIGFDYVNLGLKKIENDWIILSNDEDSDRKMTFEFRLSVNGKSNNFHFKIQRDYQKQAKVLYDLNEVISLIMGGSTLVVKDLKEDKVLFKISDVKDSTFKIDKEFQDLLKKIIVIEEKFQLNFDLPETINHEQVECIFLLNHIIEKGELTFNITGETEIVVANKEGAENLIKICEEKGYLDKLSIVDLKNEEFVLFNKNLDLGEVHLCYPKVFIKNIGAVKKKMDLLQGSKCINISLSLLNDDENILIKRYQQFVTS